MSSCTLAECNGSSGRLTTKQSYTYSMVVHLISMVVNTFVNNKISMIPLLIVNAQVKVVMVTT